MTNGSICVYEMWGQCQNSRFLQPTTTTIGRRRRRDDESPGLRMHLDLLHVHTYLRIDLLVPAVV
jgi:hypothetical protein